MTPAQCRAARGFLNWSQITLAERAGVSVSAIRHFEREASGLMPRNLAAVRAALETAGLVFDLTAGAGPGVRMKEGDGT